MEDQEDLALLVKARKKIAQLRPRARLLGVVSARGDVECVVDENIHPPDQRPVRVVAFRRIKAQRGLM